MRTLMTVRKLPRASVRRRKGQLYSTRIDVSEVRTQPKYGFLKESYGWSLQFFGSDTRDYRKKKGKPSMDMATKDVSTVQMEILEWLTSFRLLSGRTSVHDDDGLPGNAVLRTVDPGSNGVVGEREAGVGVEVLVEALHENLLGYLRLGVDEDETSLMRLELHRHNGPVGGDSQSAGVLDGNGPDDFEVLGEEVDAEAVDGGDVVARETDDVSQLELTGTGEDSGVQARRSGVVSADDDQRSVRSDVAEVNVAGGRNVSVEDAHAGYHLVQVAREIF